MRDQRQMADSETKQADDLSERERLIEFVDQYIEDHRELYDKLAQE